MANVRGQDGSATVAKKGMGELRDWALDGVSIETMDDTVKGDKHRTFLGGVGDGGTARLTCWLDGADAGQSVVIGYFAAATPQSAAGTVVLTASTGKTYTFSAVPITMSLGSPEGSALRPA